MSEKRIESTVSEKAIYDLIAEGQSGKYKHFVRKYAGRVRQVIKLKNPLDAEIMVFDIESILEVLNPELTMEISWFKTLDKKIKLWGNEKIIANRLLGLKNDNEYDRREFERIVREKFILPDNPEPTTIIQTNFDTMVEMVEIGARRFGF